LDFLSLIPEDAIERDDDIEQCLVPSLAFLFINNPLRYKHRSAIFFNLPGDSTNLPQRRSPNQQLSSVAIQWIPITRGVTTVGYLHKVQEWANISYESIAQQIGRLPIAHSQLRDSDSIHHQPLHIVTSFLSNHPAGAAFRRQDGVVKIDEDHCDAGN
jgi:hypothetical protein